VNKRECAFCPSPAKISGEHLWSDWMNALFPKGNVTFQKVEFDGSVSKSWPAKELNLKANVVCKKCNETWMSAIESDYAKPAMADLILGNRVGEITKRRAHGIALFAFKTAVVTNRMLPKTDDFFWQSERYAFRESLSIPRDVAMWLVGLEPSNSGGFRSNNIYFPNQDAPDLTLNVCTFRAGQLGFQVVSARKASILTKIESIPAPPGLTALFHPTIERGVFWPRRTILRTEEFQIFASRWNSVKFH
jgi:hypothetical protein